MSHLPVVRDFRNKAMQHAFVMAGVKLLAEKPAAGRQAIVKKIFSEVGFRPVVRKDGTVELVQLLSAQRLPRRA